MTQKNTKMKSREKLRLILKEEGPQPAKILAQRLGISTMAISQHLNDMQEQGDIDFCCEKQIKGRPVKIWNLTEKANRYFPDTHSTFSLDLISSITEAFGDNAMDQLLEIRANDQISAYKKTVNSDDLETRLLELASVRTKEGYMANVEKIDGEDAFIFIENNCPVCEAAKACSGICAKELDVFKSVLGPNIQTERSEHILKGARRCTYKVTAL